MFLEIIKLLRVKHWAKNAFIFLPIFFSGNITDLDLIIKVFVAFICFSFTASSIYIINDWKDREKDRLHPTKKNRPLASGTIKPTMAFILSGFLATTSFLICIIFLKNNLATLILAFYFLMNITYTLKLKNIAIIDITIISLGFILRIMMGGIVPEIGLSHWIILMTFLLSLFLAFAKRRDDVLLFNRNDQKLRKSISKYNLQFVDTAMSITGGVVIVAYIMYTVSPEITKRMGDYVYLNSFFVILGILQYLKLTQVMEISSSPVRLLFKSILLQLIIGGWILSFVFLLYIN